MEQHLQDEQNRDSQLISRGEAIKTIKTAFCQENAKLKYRPEEEQKLLGNFMSVVESAMLQDLKVVPVIATDFNAMQLAELFAISGCTTVYQLIAKFKSLENE